MSEFFQAIKALKSMSPHDWLFAGIDIGLVAFLIYRILLLVRGTRAWRILGGIVIFLIVLGASKALHLNTLYWLLDKATPLGPVALVILLLPELRQGLEAFGKLGFWPQRIGVGLPLHGEARVVEEIVSAATEMSATNLGALIVIEIAGPLDEVTASGVRLDAELSSALLVSIFFENSPLHDGAVVVRDNRIVAAGCRLPLSDARMDHHAHMRHRAAVGATETLACISVVVSEERGTISVAQDGRLRKLNTPTELRDWLNVQLREGGQGSASTRNGNRTKRKLSREKP